jgi:hypothetical protein
MILRGMINHMLSAHRMQLFSNKNGVVQVIEKDGGKRFIINPVESAKLAFDKAMIDAVEILNKIVEGNKNVNLNIDYSSAMIEAYKKLKNKE